MGEARRRGSATPPNRPAASSSVGRTTGIVGAPSTPNPVGSLAPTDGATVPPDKMFVQDMFPYPPARACTSVTRWLHRNRCLRPLFPDDRTQRPARVGVRLLRPARRAVRGPDRHPPAHPHRGQHRQLPSSTRPARPRHDQRRSFSTTDVDFYAWTQWIFLQIYNAWFDPEQNQAARSPI